MFTIKFQLFSLYIDILTIKQSVNDSDYIFLYSQLYLFLVVLVSRWFGFAICKWNNKYLIFRVNSVYQKSLKVSAKF